MNEWLQIVKWLIMCLILAALMRPYLRVRNLHFADGGFAVSLGLGIALSFFISWILSAVTGISFDARWVIVPVLLGLGAFAFRLYRMRGEQKNGPGRYLASFVPRGQELKRFLLGFAFFAALFLLTVWVRGFKPQVECTTEQYMDFGFVEAIYRQKAAVPEDIWFSGHPLNYYYLGQACTAYLCRLSGVMPDYAYTFMLSLVFALTNCMVFTSVQAFLMHLFEKRATANGNGRLASLTGAVISMLASCFSGNGHYLLHGIILPFLGKITGLDLNYRPEGYFFPDSTTYVGYWPETLDKGKTEFLAYSVILGDLHAHYVNQIFVLPLLILALDYALDEEKVPFPKRILDARYFLIAGLLGLFSGSNYWDFPIYYVVCGALILFHDLVLYAPPRAFESRMDRDEMQNGSIRISRITVWKDTGDPLHLSIRRVIAEVLLKGVLIFVIAKILALPFSTHFVKMASEICLCDNHTPFYKLIVLWGAPVTIAAGLFVTIILPAIREKTGQKKSFLGLLCSISRDELALLVIILCAIGLILVPEVVFVKDIYGDEYARFNTMFKLTYQAFLLLGILSGIAVSVWLNGKKFYAFIPGVLVVLLSATYLFTAIHQFMGNVFVPFERKGANVCDFLLEDPNLYAEMNAIHLIREDPKRKVRILEVGGESYTPTCKVSVFTGACTYAGWGVHEWMWRGSWDIISPRMDEIARFYQDGDVVFCKQFLKEHRIDYVFCGPKEYENYRVDVSGFAQFGERVFLSPEGYGLYHFDTGEGM